jgi:hypothetical protein
MAVVNIGSGIYLFQAETDPVKIEAARIKMEQWKKDFDQVTQQQEAKHDQDAHHGHPIIQ